MALRRIGIHTSRSRGLVNAALKAYSLGANTLQIFSCSPRMWRAVAPDAEDIRRFCSARKEFDLNPLAIHVNYLINLASLDPVIRPKSIAAFRGELERAAAIGAEFLVTHPGNYKASTPEEGMAAFALGLAEAAKDLDTGGVTVLLENTVGAGAQLGGRLAELRTMHDLAGQIRSIPVAYCLDTCHLLGSGLDIATAAGLEETAAHIESTLGFEDVRLIHANDSKGGLGSHLDRHANIGEGNIGVDGFRRILLHPAFRSKPFILETPVDEEGDDRRNMEMLKRLAMPDEERKCRKRRTTLKRLN
jgi:deoxyribonuclease IV